MDLETMKLFLRIDDEEEEDSLIQELIDGAIAYLDNTGIPKNEDNSLYCIVVKMLVSHWYENRDGAGQEKSTPYGISSLLIQLKY